MKKQIRKSALVLLFMALGAFLSLSAREVSLKDYINLVETNNRDLKKALLGYDLSSVQVNLAKSAFMPMISGNAGYARNMIERTQDYAVGAETTASNGMYPLIRTEVPANYDNELSFQLGLQQTIFDMGALNAVRAVKENEALSEAALEKGRAEILRAAKKLYYQVVLLNEVYEIRIAAEQNARENYQNTQRKFENQQLSELNVMQAEVNWQMTVPETSMAQRNLALGMSNLRQLAGIDPSEEMILTDTLEIAPYVREELTRDQILGNNLDYRIQLQALKLKQINVDSQKSSFYPTLNATAGFAHNFYNDDVLDNNGIDAFSVGLKMNIPIFYGGRRIQKVRQAELEEESARLDLMKKEDEILNDAKDLYLLLEEGERRIAMAESTWETARKAYEIIEISVGSGLSTQLEMKDARLNMDNARLGYLSAVYDYLSYSLDWEQTTGIMM